MKFCFSRTHALLFVGAGAGVVMMASCAAGGGGQTTSGGGQSSTTSQGPTTGTGGAGTTTSTSTATTGTGGASADCTLCMTTTECKGAVCAQFAGDSYCAADCTTAMCPTDHACMAVSTVEGTPASVCIPVTNACGSGSTTSSSSSSTGAGTTSSSSTSTTSSSTGATTSSSGGPPDTCGVLVGPAVQAGCNGCVTAGKPCQANGCWGGWWCNTSLHACQPPPGNCGPSTSTSSSSTSSSSTSSTSSSGGTSCAHDVCQVGAKLKPGCDPCVTMLCGSDAYCCATTWDAMCVGEVSSICSQSCSGTSSSSSSSSSTSSSSSGGPVGMIGPGGGKLDTLSFAIVGDTRPPGINDTAGYPSAVASKIWADVEAQSPRPAFAVTTGDYMFATSASGQAAPQLNLYLLARQAFSNITFPTMGNHECTGATTSNCGQGTANGITDNFTQFMNKMLAPLGVTKPWYVIHVNSTTSAWTAKFVFVAPNAWTPEQAAWLTTTLAQPTTYTFVIRHERTTANTAPGVTPSNLTIKQNALTLLIVGHTHTYEYQPQYHEVVVGNGGAPLTTGANYGYVIGRQRADGAIEFKEYDYATNAVNQTFAVKADGTPTP